jgi:signal transduction histidine kinase
MMRARTGNLKFNPAPVDLTLLTQRIVQEIKPLIPTQKFKVNLPPNLNVLGDELLLGHALWSLFTCTSALTAKDTELEVTLKKLDIGAVLEVKIPKVSVAPDQLESLFVPFHTVQYETGSAVRGAVGLYLCREIVRVHHGRLLFETSANDTSFFMELQA